MPHAATTRPAVPNPHGPADQEALPAFARDRVFGVFIAIAGFISWVAACALTLERLALYRDPNHVTSCDLNPWVSCGTVMKTSQAAVFGFPNPFIGVAGFAVVLAIGITVAAGARMPRWYWWGFQAGITLAFAFIVWLWSQALYEIHVLCPYCMVVWAMVIPLFVYTTARNIMTGVIPAGAGVRSFVAGWHWVITALLLVLCAGSIVLEFAPVFFA